MQQNFMAAGDPLSLERIRSTLVRLEDTIIFSLIERAQFAHNTRMYERGAIRELREAGFEGSWLEWFLKETETFHAKARRYTSPDEYPFTPASALPTPLLPPLPYPKILHPNSINVNPSIQSLYVRQIVPRITRTATLALAAQKRAAGVFGDGEFEDDGNYGSAVTIDVEVLQAISKRVHYGKFVSESKFRSDPTAFIPHILKPNPETLAALITKPAVERALLQRVRNKARTYGQDFGPDGQPVNLHGNMNRTALADGSAGGDSGGQRVKANGGSGGLQEVGFGEGKIDVEVVVELYKDYIIPLTKEVEVEYLLRRLDGLSQEEIDAFAKGKS